MSPPTLRLPHRWRAISLALIPIALGGLAVALLGRSTLQRSEEALRRVPASLVRYPLRTEPAVALGAAITREGLGLLTAPAEAQDGLAVDDEAGAATLIATSGGLLFYRGAPDPLSGALPPPRLYTHLDGLSSVSLRSAAVLSGGRVVLGDGRGDLSVLQRDRVTILHIKLPGPAGPILDLVPVGPSGDQLYLLMQDQGLLAWDPGAAEVVDVGRSTGVDLRAATAVCSGAAGLAVGTADGRVLRERGGRMLLVGRVSERVTALSCAGPRVYIGTPVGLYATPPARSSGEGAGPLSLLRADLFVSSLLDNGQDQGTPGAAGSLVVGTFDDGVYRFEVSGQRLRQSGHQLARQRVLRLRSSSGGAGGAARVETVLALCTTHAYRLQPGVADPAPLPAPAGAALAGPHVTALAQDGRGRLWAGTFEHGIDLLDLRPMGTFTGGALVGHRPVPSEPGGDNVNALVYRERGEEMLAATIRGIDRYGADELAPRRTGAAQGLIGDQVQALADTGTGLAAGTGRGLTLFHEGEGARSIYAFHGLAANRVYALLWQAPHLYAGTLAGVSIVEGERVLRSFTPASSPGLAAGWISALAACAGEVFIGTYGGGVSVLAAKDESLTHVATLPRFHVNPGAMLCEGGQLYVGTMESGLWRLDPRARSASRLQPALLPSPSVTALAQARSPAGPLFMIGTEAGLLWLTPERLRSALRAPSTGEIL